MDKQGRGSGGLRDKPAYRSQLGILVSTIIWCVFITVSLYAETTPNIFLIYADDQGWKDIGYQSNGAFKTPVLGKMPSEGMVFSVAYANAANCQPARACLLSGNYTVRHHVFAVNKTDRGPKAMRRLVPIPNRDGLVEDDVTIADALKAAGYATGHFGKWYLDTKNGAGGGGALPSRQGFEDKTAAPECEIELYELESDPGETTNLAGKYPEVVERMARSMAEARTPMTKR